MYCSVLHHIHLPCSVLLHGCRWAVGGPLITYSVSTKQLMGHSVLLLVDISTRPCRQQWADNVTGWVASPIASHCSTPRCHGCTSFLYVESHQPVQLRFRTFLLYANEYVEIREGPAAADGVIGHFTSNHKPGRVVEFAGYKRIPVLFNSSADRHVDLAFNFTFQPKGVCLFALFYSFLQVWYWIVFILPVKLGNTEILVGNLCYFFR